MPFRLACCISLALLVFMAPGTRAEKPPEIAALGDHRLVANMHGLLFHDDSRDLQEDVTYAQWLGAGAIRAFATDNNSLRQWDGHQVGSQVVRLAPMLRASNLKLIVALVNNHRAVPGEAADASGWLDNYQQLLLPFFIDDWRGPYLTFLRELIGTVRDGGATDVIGAWELGNELHTPEEPSAVVPFITQAVSEVRAIDPKTPIWPGTMGANHIEPGVPNSPIARWLYCEAPVDAYTLHAYDWIGPDRPGDMPINWDLENITARPCPSGRSLPIIVEELGTSRGLSGVYSTDEESTRIVYELRQLRRALSYPQVAGIGVWNAESPLVADTTFLDGRRGLTSYGAHALGGGSCYEPRPDPVPGTRCEYEQVLRQLPALWPDPQPEAWSPTDASASTTDVLGSVDPPNADGPLTLTGWVVDGARAEAAFIDRVDVDLGTTTVGTGLASLDDGRFRITVPTDSLPVGVANLTLIAHSVDGLSWSRSIAVIVPGAPRLPRVVAPAPLVPPRLEVTTPPASSSVRTGQIIQGIASDPNVASGAGIDRIEVYLEPGRDAGGQLLGLANRTDASTWTFVLRAARGWHTLYFYASSTVSGIETVIALPLRMT
jgi:hypothetical protein